MTASKLPRTDIQRFYIGAKIFITGATGFLGRILVEKLLRSCPDVSTLFLLIRVKKGKNAEVRLNEIFDDIMFDRLKEEQPNFREKVIGITGDCEEANLGISDADRRRLIEETTIVFHGAATVNFHEKLHRATMINIRGTRDILQLAREMQNLKFITHVSTAYIHCYREIVAETFYSVDYSAEQLITIAENMSPELMEKMCTMILDKFPNTYAFTKSIAEDIIKESKDLPIACFRPAIIVSTYKEPFPGWINNFYGPQGVSTAAHVGLLRSLRCDENTPANIVPVDMCVNALIAIPWENHPKYMAAITRNEKENDKIDYEIPVHHYESNTYQPITWKHFRFLTHLYGQNYPTMKAIGIYFFHLRTNVVTHTLAILFLHFLPALLLDGCLFVAGKKPMLLGAYKKVHEFSKVISYFNNRKWNYRSDNLEKLCESMSPEDKQIFFCDLRQLDWQKFFVTYLRGCRVYLLKDPVSTVEASFRKYNWLRLYTFIGVTLALIILGSLFYYSFQTVSYLLDIA